MPIEHSSSPGAFKRNVSTLMKEVGRSPHVASRKQALAIAYATQKRGAKNRQMGGFNMAKAPHIGMSGAAAYPARAMMRTMTRGALLTPTMGRGDLHKTFVPSGSYVVPADVVSGRGEGNTIAGAGVLHKMFGMGPYNSSSGPYGGALGKLKMGKMPHLMKPPSIKPPKMTTPTIGATSSSMRELFAAGGAAREAREASLVGTPVPVNLSGGEIVIPPENLISTFNRIFPGKHYTLKQIHQMMDAWVLKERAAHRKTLAKLPAPAKD